MFFELFCTRLVAVLRGAGLFATLCEGRLCAAGRFTGALLFPEEGVLVGAFLFCGAFLLTGFLPAPEFFLTGFFGGLFS